MQPPVERGSGDATMLSYSPSRYLLCSDMPEDEKPLADGVSWALASLGELCLENRHLHFELANLVSQTEDFLASGVDVHCNKAFEALRTSSS